MGQLGEFFRATIARLGPVEVIDILVVAIVILGVVRLVRGTTAASVLIGLIVFFLAVVVIRAVPQLVMLNVFLNNVLAFLPIIVIILFQSEIRRAMEQLGRVREVVQTLENPSSVARTIDELTKAVSQLASQKVGALVILERSTGLEDFNNGVALDAVISADLLTQIFSPNTPLHDGAVLVRGDRIVAAACTLPLTENSPDATLGTRHRAAIGVTELTDAVAVVVSEETGSISLANNGVLRRGLTDQRLRHILPHYFHQTPSIQRWASRLRSDSRPAEAQSRSNSKAKGARPDLVDSGAPRPPRRPSPSEEPEQAHADD